VTPNPEPTSSGKPNRSRPQRIVAGCGVAGLLCLLLVFLAPRLVSVGLFALVEADALWGDWFAGPDTRAGREAIVRWFPRATAGAVHNVYYFAGPGWTDHPQWMKFETGDTTIVSAFIAAGGRGSPLRPDSVVPYGLLDGRGTPRWFVPPKGSEGAQLLRDDSGFYYLWVSAGGRRVWFMFADH
jgi:hypothetical protein